MSRSTRARWINAGAFAVLAVIQFLTGNGSLLTSYVLPGILLAIALWLSPIGSSKISELKQADVAPLLANADPVQKPVVVYHRPGCTFCGRLKLALTGVKDKAYWVDIWDDPEAAEYVRSVNNGNETVPTVLIDGVAHTNPPPGQVRSALAGV